MSDMMWFLTLSAVALSIVVGGAVGAILVEMRHRNRANGGRPKYTQDLTRFADPGDYWSQFEEDKPMRRGRGRSLGKRKD